MKHARAGSPWSHFYDVEKTTRDQIQKVASDRKAHTQTKTRERKEERFKKQNKGRPKKKLTKKRTIKNEKLKAITRTVETRRPGSGVVTAALCALLAQGGGGDGEVLGDAGSEVPRPQPLYMAAEINPRAAEACLRTARANKVVATCFHFLTFFFLRVLVVPS